MNSRSFRLESLEPRQLLAGDVCLASDPVERIGADQPPPPVAGMIAPAGLSAVADTPPSVLGGATNQLPFILPVFGTDLLAEDGNLVAAVRNDALSGVVEDAQAPATLHLFNRQDDNSLAEAVAIDLQFSPANVILTDQLVIAIGPSPRGDSTGATDLQTVLLVVSRDDFADRSTVRLDGGLAGVAHRDDRLFVSTSQPLNVPPQPFLPPPVRVTVYDVDGDSISPIAAGQLAHPVTDNMVVGDDLLVVEQMIQTETSDENGPAGVTGLSYTPDESPHFLVRYRIVDDSIVKIASLQLTADSDLQAEISEDGQTAVVFGQHQRLLFPAVVDGPQAGFSVALIDLSDDQPQRFQSVPVATRNSQVKVEIGEHAVVVADGRNSLLVVDTDPSIDIDAESRVTRIELPGIPNQTFPGITDVTELTPDRYAIVRQSYTTRFDGDAAVEHREAELLTLSLEDHSIVTDDIPSNAALAIFSPSSSVPTLVRLGPEQIAHQAKQIVVGDIDDSGHFHQRATIELSHVLEIDVDENRLLLRHIDQLTEYRWDDLDHTIVTPLGEPLPAPNAVDDVFRRNSDARDRYLDVLENDHVVNALGDARIAELIDAPAGVQIATGGNVLRLTDEALGSEGTFEFQYVLQQGSRRATATVTLTLYRFDDADVRRAVQQIVAQTAEDLGVGESEVRVSSQRRFTDVPMPIHHSDRIENPLGGQFGVVVDVAVGDQLYRYAANFEGDVAQLSSRQLDQVMQLGLKATDAEGHTIESIRTGDEFFLEVTARDLREFGFGVFAVAFDLPLPVNQLEATGEVVLLGKFDDFGDPVTASGIDEFHALEALIEHPGSEPQAVVRFGVRAIAGGEVTLRLDPAESRGAELLLRGRDDEVSPLEVIFGSLTIDIDGIQPTDTDASGAVTPSDALRVINFLGIYGAVDVDDLPALADAAEAEDTERQLRSMQRLDTNADGLISARDALNVINDLARLFRNEDDAAEVESDATMGSVDAALASDFLAGDFLSDDDDERFPALG
ncbi:dockerin type I domain-containing protein [Rhodopirellula sp. JC639]|uniref:dockerin type I domain-containing protein n=1 Tax=Stieleria mannarensis TaxID=2755585 RepID=UPI0016006D7B|nr:dockerin type I domain-containing protein [Rhodopirellula sp. JC639]